MEKILAWLTPEDQKIISEINKPIKFVNSAEEFEKDFQNYEYTLISGDMANFDIKNIEIFLEKYPGKIIFYENDHREKSLTDEIRKFLFSPNIRKFCNLEIWSNETLMLNLD